MAKKRTPIVAWAYVEEGPRVHGTRQTYRKYGCRCRPCTDAVLALGATFAAKAAARPLRPLSADTINRFWSKVRKGDGCWEWTGAMWGNGLKYGQLTYDYRKFYAHRFALMVTGVSLADGDVVCHRCDNPRCVRPDHLFVGSVSDNVRDMYAKGRRVKGNKFTWAEIDAIRGAYRKGVTGFGQKALAKRFGMNETTIYSIVNGRAWNRPRPSGGVE